MIEVQEIHKDRRTDEIIGVTFKITGEDLDRDNGELHTECNQRIAAMRAEGMTIPELPEYSGWIQPDYGYGSGNGRVEYILKSYTVEGF